jgi:hypothetical protein
MYKLEGKRWISGCSKSEPNIMTRLHGKAFLAFHRVRVKTACTFYQDVFISVTTYKVCAVAKENGLPSNRKISKPELNGMISGQDYSPPQLFLPILGHTTQFLACNESYSGSRKNCSHLKNMKSFLTNSLKSTVHHKLLSSIYNYTPAVYSMTHITLY